MEPLTPTMQAVQQQFGTALAALIEAWLNDYALKDPVSGLDVMRKLQAGAFVTVSASSAPLTQTQSCVLTITDTKGQISELCSMSFGA